MTIRHSIFAIAIAAAAPLSAQAVASGNLSIGHPWARETAAGQTTGGGFLTVANKGKIEDRLIAARSPAAAKVEIHSMIMDAGVMKMRPVSGGLAVPPGGTLELRPGSFHIMFIGLKAPFRRGEVVPVTLTFAKAGKVDVRFKVEPVTFGGNHAGN